MVHLWPAAFVIVTPLATSAVPSWTIEAALTVAPGFSTKGFAPLINCYLTEHTAQPKPFVWTASVASIFTKLGTMPGPFV
jgi:hypothetical protein